jgi:threonine/homoserine/homoserine lactone efflux protein
MLHATAQALPFAIGVIVIAAPLLTIALVLATTATMRVSMMFVVGWAAGIMAVLTLIVVFADTTRPSREISPSVVATIRIVLGAVLAFLAFRTAGSVIERKRSDEATTPPSMIEKLASWSPRRAFITGFSLSSINPKNLAPTAAGAVAILEATQAPLEQAVAIIVFTLVASLGIAAPTALSVFGGQHINSALDRCAEWMTRHAEVISAIVLVALSAVLLVKGFGALRSAP